MTPLVADMLPEVAMLHKKEATVDILAEDTVLTSGLPHLLAVQRPAKRKRLHGLETVLSTDINRVMNSEWIKILVMDELSL